MGRGLGGIALGSLLAQDGLLGGASRRAAAHEAARAHLPDGLPHWAPRAKSVIWMFMIGGASQMETFDPKPALNRYAGKTIDETPYADVLDSPYVGAELREVIPGLHKVHPTVFPMQVGYRPRGQSGIEVSDWWPHLGGCVDDLAIVRSMWTTDNNHGAQLQFHTGRHSLDGFFPTIGAWVHYGLGSLNENLPQFVVLGRPVADCCGGVEAHGSSYLGPEHHGVTLDVGEETPLPFALPARGTFREEQAAEFELLADLGHLRLGEYPDDQALAARIKSYELAYRMQMSIPGVLDLSQETAHTHAAYGLDQKETASFGTHCLSARRLVEQGVRFVQILHGSNGGAGSWDAHSGLKAGHSRLCREVDQPIAALLRDLKMRGLLDETLVVWATEFGRTPGAQNSDGRDHHPYGFSIWMAGGGIRGGVVHGATDELGFHAVEHRHYVTDVHATVMHQLGLDSRRLEIPGRKRLDIEHGEPIRAIIA